MLEPTSKKGRPFSDPFDSQGDSYLEAPVLFVYTPEPVYKSEPESPHHENARVWFKMNPVALSLLDGSADTAISQNLEIVCRYLLGKQDSKLKYNKFVVSR